MWETYFAHRNDPRGHWRRCQRGLPKWRHRPLTTLPSYAVIGCIITVTDQYRLLQLATHIVTTFCLHMGFQEQTNINGLNKIKRNIYHYFTPRETNTRISTAPCATCDTDKDWLASPASHVFCREEVWCQEPWQPLRAMESEKGSKWAYSLKSHDEVLFIECRNGNYSCISPFFVVLRGRSNMSVLRD